MTSSKEDTWNTPLHMWLRSQVTSTGVLQSHLALKTGMTEKHISHMLTGRVSGSVKAWNDLLVAAGKIKENGKDTKSVQKPRTRS